MAVRIDEEAGGYVLYDSYCESPSLYVETSVLHGI